MIFVGGKERGEEGVGVKIGGTAWYQRLTNLNKSDPWLGGIVEEEIPDPWSVWFLFFHFPVC